MLVDRIKKYLLKPNLKKMQCTICGNVGYDDDGTFIARVCAKKHPKIAPIIKVEDLKKLK